MCHRVHQVSQQMEVVCVPTAGRQRTGDRAAFAGAMTNIPEPSGSGEKRVLMNARVQHIRSIVERVHTAVTMVYVPVDNAHAVESSAQSVLGSNCRVIKETKTHSMCRFGMVARRARQHERATVRPVEYGVNRRDSAAGSATSGGIAVGISRGVAVKTRARNTRARRDLAYVRSRVYRSEFILRRVAGIAGAKRGSEGRAFEHVVNGLEAFGTLGVAVCLPVKAKNRVAIQKHASVYGKTLDKKREMRYPAQSAETLSMSQEQPSDEIRNRLQSLEARVQDAMSVIHAAQQPGGLYASETLKRGPSLFEFALERLVYGPGDLREDRATLSDMLVDAADTTPDLLCTVMADGVIGWVNQRLADRLECPTDAFGDASFTDFLKPASSDRFREAFARLVSGLSPVQPAEVLQFLHLLDASRQAVPVAALVVPVDSGGERFVVVMQDLSLNRVLLDELQESRDNYDALSETITEAILRIDEHMNIVFANSAVRTTFGFQPEDLRGKPFSTLFPESVYARNEGDFRKYFFVDEADRQDLGLDNTIEVLGNHKHRGVAPMEISFGNSKEYRGRTLTCIIRDITQRKNVERRLRQLAYHDQLTGLGNRELFESDMRKVLATPELFTAGYAALMFLDLDGFKQVNDTVGHDAGDQLLVQTASRLRKTLRENDSVYRFGGDEFVVLLSFIHDRKGAVVVANNILAEIRRPFHLDLAQESPVSASVGVSVGIAILPDDGKTIADVTKAADLAMYSAKESGKNCYAFYDDALNERASGRWKLEQGIRRALEGQEFTMYYQPLVNSAGTIIGAEALLRWFSDEHGQVSPGVFMPVAEDTGMVVPLGGWALETALHDAVSWPAASGTGRVVSVNLSPRQFDRSDLLETIGRVLNRTGLDPGRVILELTESCIMTAPEQSIATLQALKDRYPGLSVAIDDFGTGYSSLSYLTRLPADVIKIDLSFVSNLFSQSNEKIVGAIINLGHSLGLQIIAEGVETAEQFAYFTDKNCLAFQGYHFHRPLPLPDLHALMSLAES